MPFEKQAPGVPGQLNFLAGSPSEILGFVSEVKRLYGK